MERPTLVENPDLKKLIEACERDISNTESDDYSPDDEHFVYEEAMIAFFGNKVLDYLSTFL